jgi:hypothetical protein
MGKTRVWKVGLLGLLLCRCLAGCLTGPSIPPRDQANPFLDAILKQETASKQPGLVVLRPDAVYKEIPPKMPLPEAQAIMERHGFKCWKGISEGVGTCMQCIAYRRKDQYAAQKIVVKLLYEKNRVTTAEVTVEDTIAR